MATLVTPMSKQAARPNGQNRVSYFALLVFTILYYARPEDLIPGLAKIPLEKIVGGVCLIALIAGLASGREKRKFPLELKLLIVLFVQLLLCIPFSYWKGGSFSVVFDRFSKGVIIGLLVTLVAENIDQLRRLLLVQAASMWCTTIASILVHHTDQGRLMGALGGIFENPNDLAINISMNWPLCMAFFLASKSAVRKAVWAVGLLAMMLGVVMTYSRSGLAALVMALCICLWEYGIRGKRFYLIAIAALLGLIGVAVVLGTPHYLARVESIFAGGSVEGSMDRGSWEARRGLLVESLDLAVHNPIFGIGPGNFGAVSGTWLVAHNTYTEIAAECGFPAVILFVMILALAFRNLRHIRKMQSYQEDAQIRLFTGALWASLAAYVVGAAFSSTEYHLFPYYMVGYTSVMYRIASSRIGEPAAAPRRRGWNWNRGDNEARREQKPELVWNR